MSSVLLAFGVIGLWAHSAFVPVEGGTSFMATRTAAAAQLRQESTQLPTIGYVFSVMNTPTPLRRGLLATSVPSPTQTPSLTPSPTVDAWATEYWIAEQTRQAVFTNRGVLPPATPCPPFGCDPSLVIATLPLTATALWYNTPAPDFTPAIEQTRAMDATIQAFIEVSATAQAQERSGEPFSETRAPHAPRPAAAQIEE